MTRFDKFLKKLLDKPSQKTTIRVNGKNKKIKGMARFTSVNYEGDEYIKITLHDHSHLVIIPSEKEIYYANKPLGKARGINNEMIGKKTILFRGQFYKLENKDDYQFCLQLYVGKPNEDIEGECNFSDYVERSSGDILSLGWLSYNGKRADVLVKKINLKNIETDSR